MIDPVVRQAVPADAGSLAELEVEARSSLLDARGGARWLDEHAEIGARWAAQLDDANTVVFFGLLDDVPVGFLAVVFEADGTARIDQVWVSEGARQVGFGDRLMEAAVAAGRKRACLRIEGEALPGDRETKNLYERAGITARLIVLSAPL